MISPWALANSKDAFNSKQGNDRLFELVLSRENLNHLLAGCPEIDCLIGQSRSGICFRVFNDLHGKITEKSPMKMRPSIENVKIGFVKLRIQE